MHYNRWRDGRPLDGPVKTYQKSPPLPCKVEGCGDSAKAHGWCNRHYQRWWRTGDPGTADLPRRGLITICSADGCDRDQRTKGWCDMHYRRWKRGLDVTSSTFLAAPSSRREGTYAHAHRLLAKQFGSARRYQCVGCGRPAAQWAYQHNDPAELTSELGMPYSMNIVDCYEPMCLSCHGLLDANLDERQRRAEAARL